MQGRLFEISSNGGVRVVDEQTGAVLATRPADGTEVVQLLTLSTGVVVREDYYHYPRAASNLYLPDFDLREVWRAERPSASDVYSGFACTIPKGTVLVAFSDAPPGSASFACTSADPAFEALVVPEKDRTAEGYAGYSFVLPCHLIGTPIRKVP